jgi:RNA-directed DNA polymerase
VIPKLKTSGKRLRAKLKKVEAWARRVCSKIPLKPIWKVFLAKRSGHLPYYAVSFNARAVSTFFQQAKRIMFRPLNRRSQRKSFHGEPFYPIINRQIKMAKVEFLPHASKSRFPGGAAKWSLAAL